MSAKQCSEYAKSKKLASSVISLALDDYIKAGLVMQSKTSSFNKRTHAYSALVECEGFLRGKTEIARHWFECAEMPFFDSKLLRLAATRCTDSIVKKSMNSANSHRKRLAKRAIKH